MENADIIRELNKIFTDVIDEDNIILAAATTADDVAGWDSLTHIQLVVAIERFYKIRFTAKEIQSWANVGELCSNIANKLNRS